jgi:hypothetical protein
MPHRQDCELPWKPSDGGSRKIWSRAIRGKRDAQPVRINLKSITDAGGHPRDLRKARESNLPAPIYHLMVLHA